MREANSSARSLLREPMATISCLVWARTDSTNRSAIQPEPRIPQRKMGASLAGAIRDVGNKVGKGIEHPKQRWWFLRLTGHSMVMDRRCKAFKSRDKCQDSSGGN